MELSHSNVKQAGITHGKEMSPRHMNHPGRSEVPCALDQPRPRPLRWGQDHLWWQEAADTWTPVRSSWLPGTHPECRWSIISPDPGDQDSVSFCNNQKMCGLAFQFALNWLWLYVSTGFCGLLPWNVNEHFGHEVVDSAKLRKCTMHQISGLQGRCFSIEKYNLGHALLSDTIWYSFPNQKTFF